MKRIGLIGGLGPEATLDYYKRIIDAFKDDDEHFNYPDIILYSVSLSRLMKFMNAKDYEGAANYIAENIANVKKAGAEFAAMTANTPHLMFDRINKKSDLPLISIVEATAAECKRLGLKRAGLFGTAFTMDSAFYQEVFDQYNIQVVMPDSDDRKVIHEKLFKEIELGIFKDETRQLLIRITEKMVREQHIDSLILGCTEFPLIMTEPRYAGIPMLNTTQIHVDAIVKYCRS